MEQKTAYFLKFFRTFRLANPYIENSIEFKLYNQQAEYNIPLLLFICKKLNNILIEENRDTVLFLTRDGCLISKIFKKIYPHFKSINFLKTFLIDLNNPWY